MALDRAGWRCQKCGKAARLEAHHREALARGGPMYDPDHLVILCRGCHIDHHHPSDDSRKEWHKYILSLR